ncbi:hypothetical protein GTCCBUS3UF5_17380 [Geobacillus thermoleovorans CCB_US3_UF5]|uniref:Uncharacterized protein n=1 Tax=Geobacillus thermoleovorans CCB_US3_UF5 TaxID=1111068 RepID=A0ABM5MHA6_GEOTH|nr:hypothetical protein GTCCBUS3UF5_17380 [Geobacillus thermoleovorans CCB_US3_UF5]
MAGTFSPPFARLLSFFIVQPNRKIIHENGKKRTPVQTKNRRRPDEA